jgi:hypothetical protein
MLVAMAGDGAAVKVSATARAETAPFAKNRLIIFEPPVSPFHRLRQVDDHELVNADCRKAEPIRRPFVNIYHKKHERS